MLEVFGWLFEVLSLLAKVRTLSANVRALKIMSTGSGSKASSPTYRVVGVVFCDKRFERIGEN